MQENKKIQYAVWKKETGDAGGKAKNDVYDIAEQNGFTPSYQPSEKRIIRIIQQYLSMQKFDLADVVLLQYPAVDFRILHSFFRHAKSCNTRIAIIHDLRSIQGNGGIEENIDEITLLNHFTHIISHNKYMSNYLVANGCTSKIINLELFDYLHDVKKDIQETEGDGTIVFAGNLTKSSFVKELHTIDNRKFLLYGKQGNENYANYKNIQYNGCLPSEEIVFQLKGDYGLVWDGNSIDTCSGKHGDYLRYNNPHKLSLYIAAGKPIITWKQAAIAEFVENNGIGITLQNLQELNKIELKKNYDLYRKNVLTIKKKIGKGEYLTQALHQCI